MFKIKNKNSRCYWSVEETKHLLALMKENKVMEQLDGKSRRNNNIYVMLANSLKKKGFNKRADQVKLKFRTLKKQFFNTKRSNNKSGGSRQSMDYFDDLNELLSDRPLAASVGIDTTEDISEDIAISENDVSVNVEYLDESWIDANECSTSQESTVDHQKKVSKKKRSALQMTLLEIAADIKESQQSVLKAIKEENETFIAEERRFQQEYIKDIKNIMEEDRTETQKMLMEILKK